jgi:hypothetical protein
MMVPGIYALETLVYFDRGEILKGLSAGVVVGFVVGSIAFGLAAARFISQPEWLREYPQVYGNHFTTCRQTCSARNAGRCKQA